MQMFLVFAVLLFSTAVFVYALPIILYIVPALVVALLISLIYDSIHHNSNPAGH